MSVCVFLPFLSFFFFLENCPVFRLFSSLFYKALFSLFSVFEFVEELVMTMRVMTMTTTMML